MWSRYGSEFGWLPQRFCRRLQDGQPESRTRSEAKVKRCSRGVIENVFMPTSPSASARCCASS